MTLAMAMVCKGGVILAADTRIAYTDGATAEGHKICGFHSQRGMHVIVQSSWDANAAHSLISEIQTVVQNGSPATFAAFENGIKVAMQGWYVPVYENRPVVQLLVGACLTSEYHCGLYCCEPPNTVARIYDNCKAIGEGRVIVDPIYDCWFKELSPLPPHATLCQLSYMMYKAKKLLPGSIGGETDVALLTTPETVPYWIEQADMAAAEAHGIILDRLTARFASLVMSTSLGGAGAIAKMAEGIYHGELNYAPLEFRCQFPDKTIRH